MKECHDPVRVAAFNVYVNGRQSSTSVEEGPLEAQNLARKIRVGINLVCMHMYYIGRVCVKAYRRVFVSYASVCMSVHVLMA